MLYLFMLLRALQMLCGMIATFTLIPFAIIILTALVYSDLRDRNQRLDLSILVVQFVGMMSLYLLSQQPNLHEHLITFGRWSLLYVVGNSILTHLLTRWFFDKPSSKN